MPNPLEEDIWQQIREAYAIVQSGQALEAEVTASYAYIYVYASGTNDNQVTIEVREALAHG